MLIYLLFNLILTEHIHMPVAHRHITPCRRTCLHRAWVTRRYSLRCSLEDKRLQYIKVKTLLSHNIRSGGVEMVYEIIGYNARKMYRATTLRVSIGHT